MGSLPTFPDEVIVDIVSRLPAKSVGRWRCVSKFWRDLLSEPHFIRTHLELSRNLGRESLIIHTGYLDAFHYVSLNDAHQVFGIMTVSAKRLIFPGHDDSRNLVYGSCDGLLLAMDSERKKFLLNPVTTEIKEVPPPPFFRYHSFPLYGLGYDSDNDDYKVVALSYCHVDNKVYDHTGVVMLVDVWSLKTGSWTRVEDPPHPYFLGNIDLGAFISGCIHWLAIRAGDPKCVILAFDLAEMEFYEMSVPSSFGGEKFETGHHHHAVLGGFLCIFNKTELWVMEEYGVTDSWTKFSINVPECCLRCFLDHEQVLMLKHGRFVVYNLKLATLKELVIDGIPNEYYLIRSSIESLLSPHGSNETMTE